MAVSGDGRPQSPVHCVFTACSQCVHNVFTDVHRYYSATIIRMSGVKCDEAANLAVSGDGQPQCPVHCVFTVCSLCVHNVFTDVHRYYSATIIRMSGVKSDEAAIWLSAVTAAVNFLFTMVGLYLVERIGRRPLTLGSLMGQAQFFSR